MGNSARQASMQSTSKDDDWTKVEDRAARRKIQNRRAQRRHREKIREHIAQLQAQVASASRDSTPTENAPEPYDSCSYQSSSSRPQITTLKQDRPSRPDALRIPSQEHDSSHTQEDGQNVFSEQWNSTWPYFSGHNDIFDSVYPPTPPQEFSTSPIICSALPRPSPQRFPHPQTPASRSPRPSAGRSLTCPQLTADKKNRTWPHANKSTPNYHAALSIKWDDAPSPSSSVAYRRQDPSMPQMGYLHQTSQGSIRNALCTKDAADGPSVICSSCAQRTDLEGYGGGVNCIDIPVHPNDT